MTPQEGPGAPPPSSLFAGESELIGFGAAAAAASSSMFAAESELVGLGAAPEPAAAAPPSSSSSSMFAGGELIGFAGGADAGAPGGGAAGDAPLRVAVVHGNLSFARNPLAVGHYAGDTINGAEKRVDVLLESRLSEKRELGLYPGPIGTAGVFLLEDPALRGAVVVGLGDAGTLTAARLERSFMQAVLAYASEVAQLRGSGAEGPRGASLSTLLIGSGRGGIGVEDSIRAILRGTLAAREALAASALGRRVRIDVLEFMELYEDLAIRATRLLRRLADDERYRGKVREGVAMEGGTGGRRRAAFGEEEDWWDRVVVRSERGHLVFQTPTQRAREEKRTVPQQQKLVSDFVASAVADHGADPRIPNALFELLLPNELKDYEPDRNDVVLVVDSDTARFPWELLRNARDGAQPPMSVRRGLIRQFSTSEFRRGVATPPGDGVLIVADPPTTRFRRLEGTRIEAAAVEKAFAAAGGFQVTALVGRGFRDVVAELFSGAWRVLHLAAHGVLDYVPPDEAERARRCGGTPPEPVTGMVLADDVFLQAGEVEQMRSVPELVFVNCCHLGAIEPGEGRADLPRLAAGLAEQLIRMGVRAVVAAGWAVEDAAAETFARTFYERMLAGEPFGDAVHQAREQTYHAHREVNTWGAYQCYGDHGYVLGPRGVAWGAWRRDSGYTCQNEAVVELENLAGDAEATSEAGLEELRGRLREVEGAIPPKWRAEAPVRAALAAAASRLGLFREAICHYRRLLRADRARYPVEAMEQLANLEGRFATLLWRRRRDGGTPADAGKARRRILRALERLAALPGGESMSAERWSLIGSAHKRLSQVAETPDERLRRLGEMARSYERAHRVALERRKRAATYPVRNWLAAVVALHHLRGDLDTDEFARWKAEVFDRWAGEADAANPADEREVPDFWSGVDLADGKVVRLLAEGALPRHVDEVARIYRWAWRRGGSPLSLNSVAEHLEWLVDTLAPDPAGPADPARAAAVDALRAIHGEVSALAAERRPGDR